TTRNRHLRAPLESLSPVVVLMRVERQGLSHFYRRALNNRLSTFLGAIPRHGPAPTCKQEPAVDHALAVRPHTDLQLDVCRDRGPVRIAEKPGISERLDEHHP